MSPTGGANHGCHHTTPLSADSATPLNFGPCMRGRPMTHRATREPVYGRLEVMNHDFECVLAELARLHELGMFNRDLANILRTAVKETRAWANFELVEILQQREQDDWTRFGRMHRRWEKKLQDPNDVLIEAKLLMEKQRKAGKKDKRKRGGAGSEGV